MAPIATKRLAKGPNCPSDAFQPSCSKGPKLTELNDLKAEGGTPIGCQIYKVEDNLLEWFLTISVLGDTVFEGG